MGFDFLADRKARRTGSTRPATYKIVVRDFESPFSIGVYDFERGLRQRVRVTVELTVDHPREGFTDDLRQVVSYENVVQFLRRLAEGEHIGLLETLADRTASFCLEDARVRRVVVTAEKVDFYPDAGGVGVTVERGRDSEA